MRAKIGKHGKKVRAILDNIQNKYNQETVREEKTLEMLSFLLGDELYAFDIYGVKEIVVPGRIFEAPTTPDYVRGIINLKGEVLPVIDLKQFLGISESVIDEDTRVIVVGDKNKIGFLAEVVVDIIFIPASQIQPPLATIEKFKVDYFEGEVVFDERLLSVLNLDKLMNSEEMEGSGGI